MPASDDHGDWTLALKPSLPMNEDDLFEQEAQFLRDASARLTAGALSVEDAERLARTAVAHLDRLLTVSRRLVRHADRSEARLRERQQALHELSARLAYQSRHDGLTGLLNRAAFVERAEAVLRVGQCVLILLDLDFFKSINDRYGHPVGDAVLRAFADTLRAWSDTSIPATATADLPAVEAGSEETGDGLRRGLGRLGGEEFGVVWAAVDKDRAQAELDRLLIAVRDIRIPAEPGLRVTVSGGAVWVESPGPTFETAYVCGDDALYRAKVGGRNRVEWVDDCQSSQAA